MAGHPGPARGSVGTTGAGDGWHHRKAGDGRAAERAAGCHAAPAAARCAALPPGGQSGAVGGSSAGAPGTGGGERAVCRCCGCHSAERGDCGKPGPGIPPPGPQPAVAGWSAVCMLWGGVGSRHGCSSVAAGGSNLLFLLSSFVAAAACRSTRTGSVCWARLPAPRLRGASAPCSWRPCSAWRIRARCPPPTCPWRCSSVSCSCQSTARTSRAWWPPAFWWCCPWSGGTGCRRPRHWRLYGLPGSTVA